MKAVRQNLILEIIEQEAIETQEELADALNARGVQVTQATVSRDIKELRLLNTLSPNGKYKYTTAEYAERGMKERFIRILCDSVLSYECAMNMLVIRTISAGASAACEALDSLKWPEVLGSIAGENTILMITRSVEDVESLRIRMDQLLKKG